MPGAAATEDCTTETRLCKQMFNAKVLPSINRKQSVAATDKDHVCQEQDLSIRFCCIHWQVRDGTPRRFKTQVLRSTSLIIVNCRANVQAGDIFGFFFARQADNGGNDVLPLHARDP